LYQHRATRCHRFDLCSVTTFRPTHNHTHALRSLCRRGRAHATIKVYVAAVVLAIETRARQAGTIQTHTMTTRGREGDDATNSKAADVSQTRQVIYYYFIRHATWSGGCTVVTHAPYRSMHFSLSTNASKCPY